MLSNVRTPNMLSYLFVSIMSILPFAFTAIVPLKTGSPPWYPGFGSLVNQTLGSVILSKASSMANGYITDTKLIAVLIHNSSLVHRIPPEWTILGTYPPIRIISSVPDPQRQMECRIWTDAIITISEGLVDIMKEQGTGAIVAPPGRSFLAGPVSLQVAPWFGAHRPFTYLTLSTVVSEIWQAVLADGCSTYNFEILIGRGHGIREGDHIGSIEILYVKSRPDDTLRARTKRSANVNLIR